MKNTLKGTGFYEIRRKLLFHHVAPLQGANPLGHPTVGSSALRASSPTASLCNAPVGVVARLRRLTVFIIHVFLLLVQCVGAAWRQAPPYETGITVQSRESGEKQPANGCICRPDGACCTYFGATVGSACANGAALAHVLYPSRMMAEMKEMP